eukprot:scaffold616791_cov39-Attheya_sp.AAC.1
MSHVFQIGCHAMGKVTRKDTAGNDGKGTFQQQGDIDGGFRGLIGMKSNPQTTLDHRQKCLSPIHHVTGLRHGMWHPWCRIINGSITIRAQ